MAISILASQSEGGIFIPTSISRSFTVPTGSKRSLVITGKNISSVTWNSTSLTDLGSGYFYLRDPEAGTFNIAMTFTGISQASYYSAIVFDNTKYVSPVNTSYSVTSSTTSSNTITYNSFTVTNSEDFGVYARSRYQYGNGSLGFNTTSWSGAAQFTSGDGNVSFSDNSQALATIGSGNTVYTGAVGFSAVGNPGTTWSALDVFSIIQSPSSSTISNENASNLAYNSATLNATINGNGYSNTTYIEYGTSSGVYTTQLATEILGTGSQVYSKTITGLTPSTTYYYRSVSDNGNWSTTGIEYSFTTLATPTTTTSNASTITGSSATLNGFILNGNVSGQHQFQYGIATGVYTNTTTLTSNSASASSQAISANISSLTTSVPVFYRTVLIVDGITYNGSELSFTPGDAPVISTSAVTSITDTTATLNGLVNPGGLSTDYQFEYGVTTLLGSTTTLANAGAGTTDVAVTGNLTGLSQNTTYYYRLTATNSGGTNNTSISNFTTNGMASISSFTVQDPVVYTSNTFNFTAEVNDTSATWEINYGTSSGVYTLQNTGTITSDGSTASVVSNLTPSTTYYAQLSVTNSFGTTTSSEIQFTTFTSPFTTTWTTPDLEPPTTWVNET